jgi:hypothetical protein
LVLSPKVTIVVVITLSALLGACRGHPEGGRQRAAPPIVYSPNAEPLTGGPLGHPSCEEALSAWFLKVDTSHDGTIDLGEFMADAATQFDRMDRYHSGFVTAADLSTYREPYDGGVAYFDVPPPDTGNPEDKEPRSLRGSHAFEDGASKDRSMRGPLVDTRADPVMSADKSLSFKVTREDFLAQQSHEVFPALDRNHDGRITREAVLAICATASDRK